MELGLSEHELIVTRTDLDAVRDQVFVLRSAIDDASRAMGRGIEGPEAIELLQWVVDTAQALPDRSCQNAGNPRSVK